MNFLEINNSFCVEGVPLSDIAKDYGTPAYVYSSSQIEKNFNNYYSFLREKDKVCFSVKSNSNIHILQLLSDLGSGFDVVSTGELKKKLNSWRQIRKYCFFWYWKISRGYRVSSTRKNFFYQLRV